MTIRTADESKEFYKNLFAAIKHDEDLVCAVVATSYIDYALGELIATKFIANTEKETERAVGRMTAKSSLAFCLGLISRNDLKNIECIAKIRNRFAHNVHGLTFDDPQIVKYCKDLTSILFSGDSPALNNLDPAPNGGQCTPQQSKTRFILTSHMLCMSMDIATSSAKLNKPRVISSNEAESAQSQPLGE